MSKEKDERVIWQRVCSWRLVTSNSVWQRLVEQMAIFTKRPFEITIDAKHAFNEYDAILALSSAIRSSIRSI